MILVNETPKIVCSLITLLVTRKPHSRAMVITDNGRMMEPDYLVGEGRFFQLFAKAGVSFTVQKSSCRLKLKNDSIVDFVPLRNERDLDQLKGYEAEIFALDHRCLFTLPMLQMIRSRDRMGFTMEDLKRLQTAEVEQVFNRR